MSIDTCLDRVIARMFAALVWCLLTLVLLFVGAVAVDLSRNPVPVFPPVCSQDDDR